MRARRTVRGRLRTTHNRPGRRSGAPWVAHSAIGLASAAAVTAIIGFALGLGHILWWWLLVWLAAINLVEVVFYKLDMALAAGGHRRIAERAIHVIEAAGGSLSAPFARRHFIHKVRPEKRPFRARSWSILAGHAVLAVSSLWYLVRR